MRIDISSMLRAFQEGSEETFVFPPGLSNHDRAVVHAECKKYGFTSKSHGKGESRRVTVTRPRAAASAALQEATPLGASQDVVGALVEYFAAHPPTQHELAAVQAESMPGGEAAAAMDGGGRAHRGGGGGDPLGGQSPVAGEALAVAHAQFEARCTADAGMRDVQAKRHSLPIASYKKEVLDLINSHQVIMIAGATGCGKTTQGALRLAAARCARGPLKLPWDAR